MATVVFNVAKGRIVEFYNRVEASDPVNAGIIVFIGIYGSFGTPISDAALKLKDTKASLEVWPAFAEAIAGHGGYDRKVYKAVDLTALPAPNDTNNSFELPAIPNASWPAITFQSTGNGVTTALKAVVCYDPDTVTSVASNIIPLIAFDVNFTTVSGEARNFFVDFSAGTLKEE